MEAKIAEKLKTYSGYRKQVFKFIETYVPIQYLELNVVFHSVLLFGTVTVLVAVFGMLRSLTLFSFHPLCMTLGCFIFIAEGITAYLNHTLLEAFSPIMQHNRKVKERAIHQSMQIIGACFIVMGLLFIIAEKIEIRESFIPFSIHSIVGTISILAIIIQAIIGQNKLEVLISNKVKVNKWHGDFGLVVWDLLCLSMFSGLLFYLPWGFSNFLVLFIPIIVWIAVLVQVNNHSSRRDEDKGSFDETERLMVAEGGSRVHREGIEVNDGMLEDGMEPGVEELTTFINQREAEGF